MTTIDMRPPERRPAIFWRKDLDRVPADQRRAARYALQIVARCAFARAQLCDADFLGALWLLVQPLVDSRALRRLRRHWNRPDGESADATPSGQRRRSRVHGLTALPDGVPGQRMQEELERAFRAISPAFLKRLAEADGHQATRPELRLLAESAGLQPAEVAILDFIEKRDRVAGFREFLNGTITRNTNDHYAGLAAALDLDERELRLALQATGSLKTLRLIELRTCCDFEDFILGEDLLNEVLLRMPGSVEALLDCIVQPAPASECSPEDFPHLARDGQRTRQIMVEAIAQGAAGVNVLLYGPAGTGKTQFALAMAADAGLKPVMVRTTGNDGEGLSRQGRLGAYQLAQRLLRDRRDCLIVFDEVEEVFQERVNFFALLGRAPKGGIDKGWINRTLEENPLPAIWITNEASRMDPAYLRRFLIPIAFNVPPRAVRQQIAARHLADAVPAALIEELSADDELLPAQFGAARRALALQPGADPERVVRETVSAMRRVLLGSPLKSRRAAIMPFDYSYLNVDGPVTPSRLCEALACSGRGTLCFYGPSGTGKTELAHILADALDRELVQRSAASILSRWVGGTEDNLARLFNDIDPERCILLLDEADSLLRDRTEARHGWEATMVNELLQQMERYPGIFIATTNLIQTIDLAALRRFDFKLKFRELNRNQRYSLYAREALGDAALAAQLPHSTIEALDRLQDPTAGDYANVSRQQHLLGEHYPPEQYLRRLAAECSWREVL